MPELRKDPVVGRWVIIATERARRPGNIVNSEENIFDDDQTCPFCNNKDPVILSINDEKNPSWKVNVVPSGTPLLETHKYCQRTGYGLYDVINGYGAHEVVIETPEHIANMADLDVGQIKLVLDTYVARISELRKNENLVHVLPYKNHGWVAGSRRIGHSRSQIVATPVYPLRVKEKLLGAKQYFDCHDRCIYCDLIHQEQELKQRVVLETEHFIAMTPFAARFLFEMWVFPKKHHCDFAKGVRGLEEDLAAFLKELLSRVKIGLNNPGYNYVILSAPFRREEGQDRGLFKRVEEEYHWHIEIMPRLTHVAGFEKGTGFYICPVPPEAMAEYLREVEINVGTEV